MTALDVRTKEPLASESRHSPRGTSITILGAVASCLTIGLITLVARGASLSGWHAAAEVVSRASSFVFVIWFIAEPLGVLFPYGAMRRLSSKRPALQQAFVSAYATFLAFVAAPFILADAPMQAVTLIFLIFAGLVTFVLALSAHCGGLLSDSAWRAMRILATGYFWLTFVFADLRDFYGPPPSDLFSEISLLVLIAALLIRFSAGLAGKKLVLRW